MSEIVRDRDGLKCANLATKESKRLFELVTLKFNFQNADWIHNDQTTISNMEFRRLNKPSS